jgi:hypothetical protein
MDVVSAATKLMVVIRDSMETQYVACRSETGTGMPHYLWMLRGITNGYIQHEKAHRWLGYVQGALVSRNIVSLNDMKQLNHES